MPLQKQNEPIKIGSLDTLTDLRQLPPGALTLVENMVRKKGGALQKRLGALAAITALGASGARRLGMVADELISFSGATSPGSGLSVESYSSTRARWTQQAGFMTCAPKLTDIYSSESSQSCYDVATNGNYALHAWEDAGTANSVLYRVTDLATGAVLLDGQVTAANKPKCIGVGTSLLLFYCNVNTLTVKRISISGAGALSVATTTNVGVNIHANHAYDVQARADVTRVAIAYHSTVPDVKLVDWNPATDTATTTTSVAGQFSDRCCGWYAQDWNTVSVFVAIADSANGVKFIGVTRATFAAGSTTAVDAAATDVRNVTGSYNGTNATCYYEITAASTYLQTIKTSTNGGATTIAWTNAGLASKMFSIGATAASGRFAVVLTYDSPTQKTYFVATDTQPVNSGISPTARLLHANGGGLTAKRSALSGVGLFGALYLTGVLRATRLDTNNGAFVTQTNPVLATLDFGAANGLPWAEELGGTLFISGGVLRTYDLKYDVNASRQALEAVPLLAPEAPVLVGQAGGALTALATYKYRAVYCSVDNRGRIRRSVPSDIATVTLTAGQQQVQLTLQAQARTSATYSVEYYRTTAISTGQAGSSFYRVPAFGALTGVTAGASAFTTTDTLSDAILETQEPLYTDGGELPNYAPPPFKHIESHRARLWGISTEDDREVWYSKEVQPGLGIGFHPDFKLRLEGNDGGAFALQAMDDKLIAFKRSSIYVTTGDGPDNTGKGTTFAPFSLVSKNVGTVEPESVILMPNGIMFKSQKGFWLLTRALEVQYIGAGVDAYNALDITAAVLVDDQSQARFTTSAGRTLVYDYSWNEWFTFTNQAAVSAVIWQNKFTYVLADGTVLQEAAATYADNGTAITQAVEFAPLAAAGTGGWQRIFEVEIEGDFFAASTMVLKVAYDYESTNQETLSKALGTIQVDSTYRARAGLARRNCEALRPRIEESSTGQGFALAALTLVIGVQGGKGSRKPAANSLT
jgi:hypothetical protein